MFPDSPFAVPVSSFQRPVPPPGVDPDKQPLVYVGFNQEWLAYIAGSLKQLLLQSTWKVSTSSELDLAQNRAFELLYLFSNFIDTAPKIGSAGADSEDFMIRQDPANPCLLQTSIDGVNWCTFADISKCMNFGTQPGNGTAQPPPGGGTAENCYQLQANNRLLLPTVINSGDDIVVTSQSGAGNDGGHTTWYCPDGSVFLAGLCVPGTGGLSGGDPLPTANHMSLIIEIAGVFYSLESGTFTVPGGVINQQAVVQVNDSVLSDNSGSYSVCIKITNNQVPNWVHTFDFTLTTGGWTPELASGGAPAALWTPGTGWVDQDVTFGVIPDRIVDIHNTTTISFLSSIEVIGNFTAGHGPGPFDQFAVKVNGTPFGAVAYPSLPNGAQDIVVPVGVASVTDLEAFFQMCTTTPPPLDGSGTISKIILTGTGVDPF